MRSRFRIEWELAPPESPGLGARLSAHGQTLLLFDVGQEMLAWSRDGSDWTLHEGLSGLEDAVVGGAEEIWWASQGTLHSPTTPCELGTGIVSPPDSTVPIAGGVAQLGPMSRHGEEDLYIEQHRVVGGCVEPEVRIFDVREPATRWQVWRMGEAHLVWHEQLMGCVRDEPDGDWVEQ